MKTIKYPENWKKLYWNSYPQENKKYLQKEWKKCKRRHSELSVFPNKVRKIICADFSKIIDWYLLYIERVNTEDFVIKEDLKNIFYYSGYEELISNYFKNNIEIYSCFYCDIHIIGKYKLIQNEIDYKTFDNDHFFENDQCPLLALSIKNFVPSCQVCNERVKHRTNFQKFYDLDLNKVSKKEFKEILLKISPISETSNFNNNIHFKVYPKPGFTQQVSFIKNIKSYKIKVDSNFEYKHHINAFRLEERYNTVPILSEALSILDLKKKFPLTKITELKNLINKNKKIVTEEQIEDIIFRKKYDENRHSNLLKFKQDLLN